MKKVHIVGSNGTCQYARMFLERGWEVRMHTEGCDLVQFTGGADVTPALYGERNVRSYHDYRRDAEEFKVFRECLEGDVPMAGICRGAQFLNVMCGGRMWQDVDGHLGNHPARDLESGDVFDVTSTHHQMMRPALGASILAIADKPRTTERTSAWQNEVAKDDSVIDMDDIEIVHYSNQKVLCFQPHPEFGTPALKDRYFSYLELIL